MNTNSSITSSNAGAGDNTSGGKCSVFECKELGDRRSNASLHTSMEECIAQYGACVLETGVVYAESDSVLRKQDLLSVFENIVYRNGKPDHSANASGGATDAATAANQFYSADFKDLTSAKPKAPVVVKPASAKNNSLHTSTKGMFAFFYFYCKTLVVH